MRNSAARLVAAARLGSRVLSPGRLRPPASADAGVPRTSEIVEPGFGWPKQPHPWECAAGARK
eukprot:13983380-Alexandrium_andersonii.AAC.1